MMIKKIKYGLYLIGIITLVSMFYYAGISSITTSVNVKQQLSTKDFINLTDSVFHAIKEQEIISMVSDSAKANGLKSLVLCGLSWHESDRFKYAHSKIKDSNGRWSYGLFMIQLPTALSIDSKATEEKLLIPAYNTWIAIHLMRINLVKYKNRYNYAIAAHNCGIVYNDRIDNTDFVKSVHIAIGELATKYNFSN